MVPVLLETTRQSLLELKQTLVIKQDLIPRLNVCKQDIVSVSNILINLPLKSIAQTNDPYNFYIQKYITANFNTL
jgi:hypothetical protein